MVISRFRKHALYRRAYSQQLRIRSADASTDVITTVDPRARRATGPAAASPCGARSVAITCVQCIQRHAMHGYYELLESNHSIGNQRKTALATPSMHAVQAVHRACSPGDTCR